MTDFMVFELHFVDKMLPPIARPPQKFLKCDMVTLHGKAILK